MHRESSKANRAAAAQRRAMLRTLMAFFEQIEQRCAAASRATDRAADAAGVSADTANAVPPIRLSRKGSRWLLERLANPRPRNAKFMEAQRLYQSMLSKSLPRDDSDHS